MNDKNDDFLSQQMEQEAMSDNTSCDMDTADYSNLNNANSTQSTNNFAQQNQNLNGMNGNTNQMPLNNQNYNQNMYTNTNTNGFVPNQQNMNFQNQYGQNPVRFMCSSKTTTKKLGIVPVIFVCIFVIVGAFLIFAGISKKNETDNLVKECTSQCYATITDVSSYSKRVKRNKHYTTQTYYTPTYTYTVNGQKYVKKSSYNSSSRSTYQVGMKVTIHYNPSNPDKYYPDGVTLSKSYAVTLMTGVIITMCGLVFVFTTIRQRRKYS